MLISTGTGTAIGDPTEADAIGEVFRKVRSANDPLYMYESLKLISLQL